MDSTAISSIVYNALWTAVTTAPPADAARICDILVSERLAACATRIPGAVSTYFWEGKRDTADEVVILLKTSPDRVEPLFKRLKEIHPYKVPEFLASPVAAASSDYAKWVHQNTRPQTAHIPLKK